MESLIGQIAELQARLAASEARIGGQDESLGRANTQYEDMQQRLALAEGQNQRLAASLEEVKSKSEQALVELNGKLEDAKRDNGGGRANKQKLINSRDMKCTVFTGKEPYKPWAKKTKAYCNGLVSGFRQALEWAEKQTTVIDRVELNATNWQWITEADQELYDLLVMLTGEEALTIVELSNNHGFEAWRTLFRRMDPVGEDYEFEAAESLMSRDRCKDITELPAAIEKWQRDMNAYQERTGEKMPERWSVPVLFRMIPLKNYQEVKLRWRQDPDKNITKFMTSLMQWANDLKFDQKRHRGIKPMDVDTIDQERDEDGYALKDWSEYARELEESIDWMGKGKGNRKGAKGAKSAGKGKGGKGLCHWCHEEGHIKSQCGKFAAWKKAKDEERKRKGLPPFKPGNRKDANNLEADDYDEEVGMLGIDFECDVLDEESIGSDDDWDEIGDAAEMLLNDEKKMMEESQKSSDVPGMKPVEVENKFDALREDVEDEPVDVLGAEEKTPTRRAPFLSGGLFNSPTSPASSSSLADIFAREREELLEKQASRRSPEMAERRRQPVVEPPRIHTGTTQTNATMANSEVQTEESPTRSTSTSPGPLCTERCNVEVQTDVVLPDKITVTWVPVADELAPVHDGPEEEFGEPPGLLQPAETCNDVNTVDSITGVADAEIEDLIFGDIEPPPEARPGSGKTARRQRRREKLKIKAVEGCACIGCEEPEQTGNYETVETAIVAVLAVERMVAMGRFVAMLAMQVMNRDIVMLAMQMMNQGISDEDEADEFFRKLVEDESEEGDGEFMDCEDPAGEVEDDKNPGQNDADLDQVGNEDGQTTKKKLKRGITVDSGAHHNVMPRRLARNRIRPSEGSKRGMNYVSASKCKIPNEGETDFDFFTVDGIKQSWEFQIAEVNKALAAVSDRVDHDFRVVFDKDSKTGADASYMLHKPSKQIIKMTRVNNVWIVEAIVNMKKSSNVNFARRG